MRLSPALVFAFCFTAWLSPSALAAPSPAPRASPTPNPRAWPSAYEETALSLKDVLDAVKRAAGTLGDGPHTLRLTSAYHASGMDGIDREVWSGKDYRVDSTLGPFVSAVGRYQDQQWETNENGYTLLRRGIHKRGEANERALENAERGDDVKLLGRLRTPSDVYVLSVSPPDGREERRFYDATTFLLVRKETAYLKSLIVRTYEDYRTVNGVVVAYKTTRSDGRAENDALRTIQELRVDTPVLAGELTVPGSRRVPVTLPPGASSVRLPARIDPWGRVIVRLTINGRGLDFQLDSGAAEIVVDRQVVRELGLTTHGRWSQTVAGTFTGGYTVIPKVEIGEVVMNDVVVASLPFSFENDTRTRVVGLLGFDFIAGAVIKIDYEHGTVDAIRAESFHPPENAILLDAILDDSVPLVWLKANGAIGERFILDTGADDVVFFSGFAKKYPAAVEDNSPKKILSRLFNVVHAEGVGGRLRMRPLLVAEMQLGNVRYKDYLAFVMSGDQPAFEGEEQDGLVGAAVLRAFDVYLDYAESRVLLVPNKTTKKIEPPKKPAP